jgi:acyl-CoA synthetase (AMP-forming)/AMP-acid ligase II
METARSAEDTTAPRSVCSAPLRGEFATVAEALLAAAEQFADHDAYVEGARRISFGEWMAAAECAADAMAARGVRPGDVVAILLPASIEYAIAYAAVALVGGVATGLNTRLGPREVAAICERARPALAVVPAGPLPPGVPPAVPTLDGHTLAALPRRREPRERHRGAPSDPAVIIWTSGTTGLPKGAWFDHANLKAAVTSAGALTAPFDRRLVATPFAHAGYMAKLWEQAAWATTVVISPTPWTAADMLSLLVDERITVAGAVPTQWARLLQEPGVDGADLSSLRLGVAAAAPAAPELVERVAARCGCPLVVRYAMTESPSITGTDPGDPPEVLFRTVGRPQAGVEISLRDDQGVEVAAGTVGRVHVRGSCVMRGYWRDAELTAEALIGDGWLRSSDLGHLDPDGNLVLDGRVGDMYIRGGYNVYPLEVENVLAAHPAVAQAAVVGAPADELGEVGVAFVVAQPDVIAPTLADLRSWCRAHLAGYKAPDRLHLVDALPLTAMLKVDKARLRDWL